MLLLIEHGIWFDKQVCKLFAAEMMPGMKPNTGVAPVNQANVVIQSLCF